MAWEVASKYYRELICLEPFPQIGEQTTSMGQQQVSQVLIFKAEMGTFRSTAQSLLEEQESQRKAACTSMCCVQSPAV